MNRSHFIFSPPRTLPGQTAVRIIAIVALLAIVVLAMFLVPVIMAPQPKPADPKPQVEQPDKPIPPMPLDLSGVTRDFPAPALPGDQPPAADTSPGATPPEEPAAKPPLPDLPQPGALPPAVTVDENAPEDLQPSLPKLSQLDQQTLENPRQSSVLLPALRKYQIDFSAGQRLLEDVRDETDKFDESPLYWVFRVCDRLPRELFVPAPDEEEVPWEMLWKTPQLYRGWPVTVSGRVANVYKWPLPHPETIGLENVWMIDIYKPVSGAGQQSKTCTVFVTEDPGELDKGTPVKARGFFFKIRKYRADLRRDVGDGGDVWIFAAPVVVGKILVVDRPPVVAREEPGVLGPALVVALIVFALIVFFFVRRMIGVMSKKPEEIIGEKKRDLSDEERRQRMDYLDRMGRQPPENPAS